jgi:hypothetical protein
MPEVKNTFLKSKMNKDLDARILPNGEYRDAQNVNVSKSEGEDVGSLENVLSNIQISNIKNDIVQAEILNFSGFGTPPTESQIENSLSKLEIIGELIDTKNNRIFLMLTNYTDTSFDRLSNFAYADIYTTSKPISFIAKGAGCYIYVLDFNTNINTVLVGGNFLNFSKTHIILNANILEDLLFWTDDRNQPRKINVNRALNESFSSGNPYYYNEDHISVAKFAPVLPISLIEEVAANSWESTMQSVTQEYLPIHLIDSIAFNKAGNEELVVLERKFPAGTSSSLIQEGDKVIIENDDGEEFEYNIKIGGGLGGGGDQNSFNIEGTFEDGGLTDGIKAGWVVKLQRRNPIYDQLYIGDRNVLKDKFYRFSYRFKYDDNEYSLFAPFTQEVFVPKQFGYFLDRDENKTGRSGIVSFMENIIDKVKFNIRLPYLGTNMENSLKVKEIQIVSKASDEQAVKVIEDVPVADLTNTQDYIYEYNSIKPYKTLPENELTRVHDKVPIRAKCQEVTSNRVIYGNYIDKHTSPDFLDYELRLNVKNNISDGVTPIAPGFEPAPFSQIRKEYPNHTLKQNRSYTVGVVLMDRYGRPSNVILSKQEVITPNDLVSTIYAPYTNNGANKVHEWPGNLLEIQFNQEIQQAGPDGYPGLYSETNPLGWYSYKLVVKQQEQEYYNVYVAGILAGEISWTTTPIEYDPDEAIEPAQDETAQNQPNYINSISTSLISLFGDNINKIPRNLNEVGTTDIDFGSSTLLFNRVNPNSWDDNITYISEEIGPAEYKFGVPYNVQSNVDSTPDTIDFIKPFKQFGEWTTTKGNLYPGQQFNQNNLPFKDPWYPFTGVINTDNNASGLQFKDPLFKANENPFIASISTQFKTGVQPKKDTTTFPNYEYYRNTGENRLGDTTLGVYETNPTESLLELFWETSTAGLIENDSYIENSPQYTSLNDAIYEGSGGNGPFIISNPNWDWKESDPINTLITDDFTILQKDGNPCNDNNNIIEIIEVKNTNGSNRTSEFEVVKNPRGNGDTTWSIINKKVYAYLSDANTNHNYQITLKLTANGQTVNITTVFSLSNAKPKIISPIINRYWDQQYGNDFDYKIDIPIDVSSVSEDGSNWQQTLVDKQANGIVLNCSGIAGLKEIAPGPNIIPTSFALYNELNVVNGVDGDLSEFDSIRQIKRTCDLKDVNDPSIDFSNALQVYETPQNQGSEFIIAVKSTNIINFPAAARIDGPDTLTPVYAATFEVVSTDVNGNGLETSEQFRCIICGPEYNVILPDVAGTSFVGNVKYSFSMKN